MDAPLISDPAEVQATLDGLPAITDALVVCPVCYTPLRPLDTAGMYYCDPCRAGVDLRALDTHQAKHG